MACGTRYSVRVVNQVICVCGCPRLGRGSLTRLHGKIGHIAPVESKADYRLSEQPHEALIGEDGWQWVSPVLGFVIVIVKTTGPAVPVDELRRSLARERRLFLAGSEEYAPVHTCFRPS